jgi:hypothetical protein
MAISVNGFIMPPVTVVGDCLMANQTKIDIQLRGFWRVADVFVSDLARIDLLGRNARFTFYVDHYPSPGAAPVKLTAAKLIMPIDVVPLACARSLFTLGHATPEDIRELSCRVH